MLRLYVTFVVNCLVARYIGMRGKHSFKGPRSQRVDIARRKLEAACWLGLGQQRCLQPP